MQCVGQQAIHSVQIEWIECDCVDNCASALDVFQFQHQWMGLMNFMIAIGADGPVQTLRSPAKS